MKNLLKSAFSYKGRITRKEFWLLYLAALVVQMMSLILLKSENNFLYWLSLIIFITSFYSIFATAGKRWHDRGKSARMNYIIFLPIAGTIWFFVELGFLAGTVGKNKYGEDPRSRFCVSDKEFSDSYWKAFSKIESDDFSEF